MLIQRKTQTPVEPWGTRVNYYTYAPTPSPVANPKMEDVLPGQLPGKLA